VTIWGEKATSAQYDWQSNPIVAFKGLRVSDYGGRSLGAISGTSITVSPEVPEGIELFNWRNSFPGGVIPLGQSLSSAGGSGGGIGNDSIEKRIELSAIKDNNMGVGEKPDWATVKGSISFLKHDNDPWYTACTGADCNKKVVEGPGGNWICEKCNITTQDVRIYLFVSPRNVLTPPPLEQCNYRYVLSLCLIDNSASTWVSLFNEQAEALLGKTAKELYDMRANDNQADYERVFSDCMFRPYLTKLRIKQETVGDEMRTKSVANTMAPMDYPGECRKLIEAINKY
jgi:replication factor A1